MNDNLLALPKGYQLNHYTIDEVLGQGGFGIVYKAHHELLDEIVVIKEFLPVELAGRSNNTVMPHTSQSRSMFDECRRRFIDEGRTLIKLKHPYVVRCRDLFEANETAYLVMDFEEGLAFDVLLKSLEDQGGRYTESQLLFVAIRLAEGLEYVHQQNVLHRDIKPGNIFIRRLDNTPVLLDFGAAKQNFAEVSQSQAPFTEFYAPIDQLDTSSPPTAAIDIHAFGGLLYRAVTGQIGPKAETRTAKISMGQPDPLPPASQVASGNYSEDFLGLIDQCLAFKPEDRPQSMQAVVERLRALKSRSGETQIDIPGKTPPVQPTPTPSGIPSPSGHTNNTENSSINVMDELLNLAGADGVISSHEMKMLLSKAQEFGMSEAEADDYITRRVRREGWRFESSNTAPPPKKKIEDKNAIKEFPSNQKKKGGWGVKVFVFIIVATLGIMAKLWMGQVDEQYLTINAYPVDSKIEVLNLNDNTSIPFEVYSGEASLLPEGTYEIVVSANGFETQSHSVVLQGRDVRKEFNLKAKTFNLNVNTTPANAKVKVNAFTYEGSKKSKIALAPNQYTVNVSATGYLSKDVKVDLRNSDQSITVKLDQLNYRKIAEKAYKNKDYKKAFTNYRLAARAGDKYGMDWTGFLYEEGKGTNKDYAKAIYWYKKGVEIGYANSMVNLGDMYYNGRGVDRDYKEAFRLFKQAEDKGSTSRTHFIAYQYEYGQGVTKNYANALSWYKKAAGRGNVFSYNRLGVIYEEGKGVTKNLTEAKKWYQKGADKNDLESLEDLARLYYKEKSFTQAYKYYKKAADKNSNYAINYIGWMHQYGEGVNKDYKEAVRWYKKAANKDYTASMANLGYMYENGKGTTKNISEAVKWYKKAAKKGNKYSQGRLEKLGYSWK